jgi:type IV pilus assembly protein PilN
MVKLNLIGRKRVKQARKPFQADLLVFFLLLSCILGGIFYYHTLTNDKIAFLKEQVELRQTEYRKLQHVKHEVDGFRRQMDEIQKKIEIVRNLKEGQKGYYKILTSLEKSMPDDVWVDYINIESGKIVLSCSSLHVSSVNRFVMNLYETGVFTAIDLERADKKEHQSIEINNFVINAGLRFD